MTDSREQRFKEQNVRGDCWRVTIKRWERTGFGPAQTFEDKPTEHVVYAHAHTAGLAAVLVEDSWSPGRSDADQYHHARVEAVEYAGTLISEDFNE